MKEFVERYASYIINNTWLGPAYTSTAILSLIHTQTYTYTHTRTHTERERKKASQRKKKQLLHSAVKMENYEGGAGGICTRKTHITASTGPAILYLPKQKVIALEHASMDGDTSHSSS